MRLFREKGFDNVTIAEISEAADVDATTFWRHFGSKHAILYADQEVWLEDLKRALDTVPDDASAFSAVVSALATASLSAKPPEFEELRAEVLRSSPSPEVHAAILTFENLIQEELAKDLSRRLGVDQRKDPRPAILSAAIVSATRWARLHGQVSTSNTSPVRRKTRLQTMIRNAAKLVD
jgi:AcrR family transcriptional regulator